MPSFSFPKEKISALYLGADGVISVPTIPASGSPCKDLEQALRDDDDEYLDDYENEPIICDYLDLCRNRAINGSVAKFLVDNEPTGHFWQAHRNMEEHLRSNIRFGWEKVTQYRSVLFDGEKVELSPADWIINRIPFREDEDTETYGAFAFTLRPTIEKTSTLKPNQHFPNSGIVGDVVLVKCEYDWFPFCGDTALAKWQDTRVEDWEDLKKDAQKAIVDSFVEIGFLTDRMRDSD